jgi:hypothetical protein
MGACTSVSHSAQTHFVDAGLLEDQLGAQRRHDTPQLVGIKTVDGGVSDHGD